MTPLIQQAVKLAPEPESAMWFDVGQMDPIGDIRVDFGSLMKLPFHKTGIAGIDTKNSKFALWLTAGDGSLIAAGSTINNAAGGAFGKYFDPVAFIATDEGLQYYVKDKEVTQADVLPLFRMVCGVLLKLQSASEGYKPTPQRTFTNQRRIAKGKPPTYDWHTVVIEKPSQPNDPQGGTHASPRRHQCRGHWRNCKSGKRVWVRDCWKGDASKGNVFKDYKVKNETNQSIRL